MKALTLTASLVFLATTAAAQAPSAAPSGATAPATTCKASAAEKKLAGAALNSFMKKCQSDAQKRCAAESKEQKLKGAAATSHTKKCVSDAVGT